MCLPHRRSQRRLEPSRLNTKKRYKNQIGAPFSVQNSHHVSPANRTGRLGEKLVSYAGGEVSNQDVGMGEYVAAQVAEPIGSAAALYVRIANSDPEVIEDANEYPGGRIRADIIQTPSKNGVPSLRADFLGCTHE